MFKVGIENSSRWGPSQQLPVQTDLLLRKDQQIRRLQAQLQAQRKRADNAVRMLDTMKQMIKRDEQNYEGLKSQINRRIRAEEEAQRLLQRNSQLQDGIRNYVEVLTQRIYNNDVHNKDKELCPSAIENLLAIQ